MKKISYGRNEKNDRQVSDSYVSGNHCQIVQLDNGTFKITDFDSRNGTYVNEQRISGESVLKRSDVVRIGHTTLDWVNDFPQQCDTTFLDVENVVGGSYRTTASDDSSSSYNILVFVAGLGALFIDLLLVIRYFTSFSTKLIGAVGGSESTLKFFPIWLHGSILSSGQWGWIISALILGTVSSFISGVLKYKEDKLSRAGERMGRIALVISGIFLLLAILAPTIADAY